MVTLRWKWGLALLGLAALPLVALADEESDRFTRLDANKDGFLQAAEVGRDGQRLFERLLRTADKNSDGKLSQEEFLAGTKDRPEAADDERPAPREGDRPNPARAEGLFDEFDKNKDGKITEEEVPDDKRETFRRMLERLDDDGDKALTKAQFVRALAALQPGGDRPAAGPLAGQNPEEAFKKADANGDGKLEEKEVPEQMKPIFGQLLERFDRDGDKALSLREFGAAMQGLALRRGGDAPPAPRVEGEPARRDPPRDGDRPAPREGDRPAPRDGDRAAPRDGDRAAGPPGGGHPLMAVLDADKDGIISASEIADAPKLLAKLDVNNDGRITPNELPRPFAGGRPDVPSDAARVELILRVFKEADRNGDGKLSREEAPPQLRDNFERLDSNRDGQIDNAEIRQLLGGRDAPRPDGPPRDGDRPRDDRPRDGDRPRDPPRREGDPRPALRNGDAPARVIP